MKKTTLLLTLIATALSGSTLCAQTTETATIANPPQDVTLRKHEVKLGAVKALAGAIIEGTYEYIHSESFTYGVSVLGNLDSKNNTFPELFSITPFARMYFTEPRHYGARGFFVEGFGKFIAGQQNYSTYDSFYSPGGVYYSNYIEDREKYTAGSLGLCLGWKWINKSGFVFEILAGGGRNFGGNGNMPDATFRGDFNIGYRF